MMGARYQDVSDLAAQVEALTRIVADFPEPGIEFHDLSGVYAEPQLVRGLAAALADYFSGQFDCVLAVEARGFLLGTPVALSAMKPLALCRKPGKLPGPLHTADYALEYGTATLQVQRDRIPANARVLVVDDVLATGGTLAAAEQLVSASGARVCGHGVIVELAPIGGRERLGQTPVFAIRSVS